MKGGRRDADWPKPLVPQRLPVLAERNMPSSFQSVDQLFPLPAPSPSVLSPKTLPGDTYEFKFAV